MDVPSSGSLHQQIYDFAAALFPYHRSLTGNGVRKTLQAIGEMIPGLRVIEVPSGTPAFDWEVPCEWNIRNAYVTDETGRRVIDLQDSTLHVVAYSEPVNKTITLEELNRHLHSLPDQPDAIPFVMSYYKRQWGFCVEHRKRLQLKEGLYHVVIDSTLEPGYLTYGELVLPGREAKEILLSTYLCHPSMANDSISGVSVSAFLAQWLNGQPERRFTYRILFIPETIGSIVYLSRHLSHMKKHTVAGFVVTCAGDDRTYSFVPSRLGNTLADKVALHVLRHHAPDFNHYSFLNRGSDERQYCFPGIDLPVVSIMRSKYRNYPEYHTSLDDLSLITPTGLGGTFEAIRKCIVALERNHYYKTTTLGEPQLGKRGLLPTLSVRRSSARVSTVLDLLNYSDGCRDLIDIANTINVPIEDCYSIVDQLLANGLIERLEHSSNQ